MSHADQLHLRLWGETDEEAITEANYVISLYCNTTKGDKPRAIIICHPDRARELQAGYAKTDGQVLVIPDARMSEGVLSSYTPLGFESIWPHLTRRRAFHV